MSDRYKRKAPSRGGRREGAGRKPEGGAERLARQQEQTAQGRAERLERQQRLRAEKEADLMEAALRLHAVVGPPPRRVLLAIIPVWNEELEQMWSAEGEMFGKAGRLVAHRAMVELFKAYSARHGRAFMRGEDVPAPVTMDEAIELLKNGGLLAWWLAEDLPAEGGAL